MPGGRPVNAARVLSIPKVTAQIRRLISEEMDGIMLGSRSLCKPKPVAALLRSPCCLHNVKPVQC